MMRWNLRWGLRGGKSRSAPIALLVVACALAQLAAGPALGAGKSEPQYQTAKVDRAPVVSRVSCTGTMSAIVNVQVGSQVSGRILTWTADFNSVVKKGQVLATLDPALFKAALAVASANEQTAQAALVKAKVNAANDKIQLDREKQLMEKNIVAQQDLDNAKTLYDSALADVGAAEAALAQARATRDQAQLNLNYTNIISPVDGTVISRNIDLGQTVAAAFAAPLLFLIAQDLHKMQIDTSVSESDVGRLSDRMKANFTLDAFPGQSFDGVIRQIRNNSTTVQNVVTYDAVIDVENPKLLFRPGMTATVTIITGIASNALRVPNAAMRFTPPRASAPAPGQAGSAGSSSSQSKAVEAAVAAAIGVPESGGLRTVWVLRDKELKPVSFKPGLTDGTFTEVAGGELHEGDVLVTDILNAASSSGGFRAF